VAIFPCVGAANVGQLSNRIAIEFEKQGIGNLMCTAGIGARAPGLIKSAEASDRIIAIDSCPVNCASKTLELAGFKADHQIVISELGVRKSKERNLRDEEVADVLGKIMEILQSK
jgi:uncharacterized metal-binding protein